LLVNWKVPPDVERAILPALKRFPHQEFWQAPYGIIWYALNLPFGLLANGNGASYIFWIGLVNVSIAAYCLFRLSLILILVFVGVSIFHTFKAPWNVPILWLCLLGFINPLLLAVPIIAKFPIGNTANRAKTWRLILFAMHWQKNPFYYATIGIVWIMVLLNPYAVEIGSLLRV
jgi:hypothetical protein